MLEAYCLLLLSNGKKIFHHSFLFLQLDCQNISATRALYQDELRRLPRDLSTPPKKVNNAKI